MLIQGGDDEPDTWLGSSAWIRQQFQGYITTFLSSVRTYEMVNDAKLLPSIDGAPTHALRACGCVSVWADFSLEFFRHWRRSSSYQLWHQRAFDRGLGEAYWLKQPRVHPGKVCAVACQR